MIVERKPERSIRLSQGITTHGVGAIIGIGEESFINKDIFKWYASENTKVTIKLPRLAQRLRVQEFQHPKPKTYNKRGGRFRFMRFPRWLFCPMCRTMHEITFKMDKILDGEIPRCSNVSCRGYDKKQLIPMRFVVVCENGHIDDFPWWRWAHSNTDRATHGHCETYDQLEFITATNAGASWAALEVRCKKCHAKRSLEGLENKDALKGIGFKCRGKQPWQHPDNASECDEVPQMVQRNASNIFQPIIVSAIDIPTDLNSTDNADNDLLERIQAHPNFSTCRDFFMSSNGNSPAVDVILPKISQDCDCSEQDVRIVLEGGVVEVEEAEEQPKSTYDLRQLLQYEEWPMFFEDINEKKFINEVESLKTSENQIEQTIISLLDNVSLVKRLKEVRAFKGFNRVKFDPGKMISASLGQVTKWLPAIEVYGEGIFISLDRSKLDEWYDDNKDILDEKLALIKKRYEKKEMEEQFGPFSAKFIVLHTLSHLLIRQLAFESGYNSSSLRENIYFSDKGSSKMAGILIYTADSDSEGSLGGLVRQGESDRLLPTIIVALQRALWCSADPVCIESKGQGQDGLNKAACHACSLISETSCTHFNALLDRTLLIDNEIGFFKDVYKVIKEEK